MPVTASIVLYHNNILELEKVIKSVLNTQKNIKLYLIDNSQLDTLRFFEDKDSRISYFHNAKNIGFGAAHNIAIEKAININSEYHIVVNPDIYYHEDIISPMLDYMRENPDIGMMMPEVLNIDGTVQFLPKLLPSPFRLLIRKLKWPKKIYEKIINKYELRFVEKGKQYFAPILSGCFTVFSLKALKEVGFYDDNYFLYFEDWDLSRRMQYKYKTLYYPLVSVYHGYDSGANKSYKLLKIYVKSAIIYFNKWGWFFDRQRSIINKKTLAQFK